MLNTAIEEYFHSKFDFSSSGYSDGAPSQITYIDYCERRIHDLDVYEFKRFGIYGYDNEPDNEWNLLYIAESENEPNHVCAQQCIRNS